MHGGCSVGFLLAFQTHNQGADSEQQQQKIILSRPL